MRKKLDFRVTESFAEPKNLKQQQAILKLPEGDVVLDLSNTGFDALAIKLATNCAKLVNSGGINWSNQHHPKLAALLNQLIRIICFQLEQRGCELKISEITGEDFDSFESWLISKYGLDSKMPYFYIVKFQKLLRYVISVSEGEFSASFIARQEYSTAYDIPQNKVLDAYSFEFFSFLRREAENFVEKSVQRVLKARSFAEDARNGPFNVLKYQYFRCLVDGPLVIREKKESDKFRFKFGVGYSTVNLELRLGILDVAVMQLLLACQTGLEPEVIRSLKRDCLSNSQRGYITINYVKNRACGSTKKSIRVRDGASFSTPGGLIRIVKQLTEDDAEREKMPDLWLCGLAFGQLRRAITPELTNGLRKFVSSLSLGEFSDEFQGSTTVDLRRIRKTVKSKRYIETLGDLDSFATGHSKGTAGSYYADIPSHALVHDEAVQRGLESARRIASADNTAAGQLSESNENQVRLPMPQLRTPDKSSQDDVWTATCMNFYDSPYAARPGNPCPFPSWGCFQCENAVFSTRNLHNLLSFLSFMDGQKDELQEDIWTARYSESWNSVVNVILPQFTKSQIETAWIIVEQNDGKLLPKALLEGLK